MPNGVRKSTNYCSQLAIKRYRSKVTKGRSQMRSRSKNATPLFPLALALYGCGAPPTWEDSESVGSAQQHAYLDTSKNLWFDQGHNNHIPVCWRTAGMTHWKGRIQQAVESSWESRTGLNISGWQDCPPSGTELFVTLDIVELTPRPKSWCTIGTGALRLPTATDPSCKFYFTPTEGDNYVMSVAHHEFGHLIGYLHNYLRQDEECDFGYSGDIDGELTEFDLWSIMNGEGCRARGSLGRPSGLDILAAQFLYGSSSQFTLPSRNFCAQTGDAMYTGDFSGDTRDDILCNRADGYIYIDYANANGQFWSNNWSYDRDFCTGAGDAMYVGNFNGDSQYDILCNHPSGYMEVDLADASQMFTGNNFSYSRGFCVGSGDEMDVGDFNGDGRTDLLCIRDNGNMFIDLANANGQFWSDDWSYDRDFCHLPQHQLYVGDFNGDGRDDLLCNNELTGWMQIDYANADGRFYSVNWEAERDFCLGSGKRLRVADMNGDGQDDLVCRIASTGQYRVELADSSGAFDDVDDDGNVQRDAVGPLAARCVGSDRTFFAGQFNGKSRRRADLLCHDDSGGILADYDFGAPILHETGLVVGGQEWLHYGPFTVEAGNELNALMSGPAALGSGFGDADLYVKRGGMPTTGDWDCRDAFSDPDVHPDPQRHSMGACRVLNAGDYYVSVYGKTAASEVELEVFLETFGDTP